MQSHKKLLLFLCLLSLQTFAKNTQITSREQHIEQIKHDYETWKIRDQSWGKVRNISGGLMITAPIIFLLGSYVGEFHRGHKGTSGWTIAMCSLATLPFSSTAFFASFFAKIFSSNTVNELNEKLKALGYDVDEEELLELQRIVTTETTQ